MFCSRLVVVIVVVVVVVIVVVAVVVVVVVALTPGMSKALPVCHVGSYRWSNCFLCLCYGFVPYLGSA